MGRGLERDRKRRWPDLESFRQGLLALKPSRLDLPGLGRRIAAFTIDAVLLWLVVKALGLAFLQDIRPEARGRLIEQGIALALFLGYFTLLERIWGCTLGKGLLGLRGVRRAGSTRPAGARPGPAPQSATPSWSWAGCWRLWCLRSSPRIRRPFNRTGGSTTWCRGRGRRPALPFSWRRCARARIGAASTKRCRGRK